MVWLRLFESMNLFDTMDILDMEAKLQRMLLRNCDKNQIKLASSPKDCIDWSWDKASWDI